MGDTGERTTIRNPMGKAEENYTKYRCNQCKVHAKVDQKKQKTTKTKRIGEKSEDSRTTPMLVVVEICDDEVQEQQR